jgi:2-enoate reductase
VGGGVAGMEAARVAAMRGNQVLLYEKGKALGGHLIEASVPGFKKDLGTLLNWYKNQLKNLSVAIKLETVVSADIIAEENPDVVIVATGSKPLIPDLPGIKKDKVFTCIDVLLGRKKVGQTVVVIGGGLVGCETALWLAEKGKEVTLVEILPELMASDPPVPQMNRQMLLDLLALNKVKIMTGARVQEITREGIIVAGETSIQTMIKADNVVLASGLESDDGLYQALRGQVAQLYAVGDCREPRNIMGALWDGYEVGRAV